MVLLQKRVLDRLNGFLTNYEYLKSIFVFSENGEVMGTSGKLAYTEVRKREDYPFYKSPLYQNTKNKYKNLIWDIGDKSLYFDTKKGIRDNETFLSASRALRWINASKQSATLVLNINGDFLSSIYKYISKYKNSSMYIIDGNGNIISNNDTALVGKFSEISKDMHLKKISGSFTTKINNINKQIIFYHLKKFNWTFIQEIPVNDYIRDIMILRNKVILILLVSFFSVIILTNLLMNKITKPLKTIANAMSNMEMGQIGYKIEDRHKNEFGILIKRFNKMSKSIEELIDENRKTGEQKRAYEIEALQSQINPHFLYNTLNFIKWMAVAQKANNIVEAITSLGNMLVPIFRNKTPLSSILEEVNYIKNYLILINLRYGDGIKFIFQIEENIFNYKIPKFVLQPIVENSVFHGFDNWFKNNSITISGCEVGEEIEIKVDDNGKGMEEDKLEELRMYILNNKEIEKDKKSIGLNNIDSRLKLHFGEKYGIEFQSVKGSGTKVIIRIPKVQ